MRRGESPVLVKGDRVVFLGVSSEHLQDAAGFKRICLGLGLVPVSYVGAGIALRASNLDTEMTDDLYGSKALVLYLGSKEGRMGWVGPELSHVVELGIHCFAYTNELVPSDVLQTLPVHPRFVSNREQFADLLQADLLSVLES